MHRSRLAVVAVLALTVAVTGLVLAGATHAGGSKTPVTMTPDNLKWEDVPNANGVQVSTLWGKMDKGAYGAFVKFPAGISHPMHTHSGDIKIVVISGTMIYTPEGQETRRLGPGSFAIIPGGSKHTSGSDPASELIMFQEQTTKFDMKPIAENVAHQ